MASSKRCWRNCDSWLTHFRLPLSIPSTTSIPVVTSISSSCSTWPYNPDATSRRKLVHTWVSSYSVSIPCRRNILTPYFLPIGPYAPFSILQSIWYMWDMCLKTRRVPPRCMYCVKQRLRLLIYLWRIKSITSFDSFFMNGKWLITRCIDSLWWQI